MTSKTLHLPVTHSSEFIIEGEKKVWTPVKEKKEKNRECLFFNHHRAHAAISIKESQINEKKARQIYLCKKNDMGPF